MVRQKKELAYVSVANFLPLRIDEIKNSVTGAGKGTSANEQRDEYDIRKESCKVGDFAGRCDSFNQHTKD